jgi:predicted amidohydrolase
MKLEKIKIGIIQIATKKLDLDYNFTRSVAMIRKGAEKGAKILCTNECMLDGYAFEHPKFKENPDDYCVPITSQYFEDYKVLAQELGVYLLIGCSLLEFNGEKKHYRNSIVVIGPMGVIIGVYNKVHSTYSNFEAVFYKHGEDFPVWSLDFDNNQNKVNIGIMICYDRQMPETARILAVRGAEIIFNPSATGNFRRGWNTHMIQTRAYENKCYVVSTNHGSPRINGRSFVADPNGKVIARCPFREHVKVVELDLTLVRSERKNLFTRRPTVYDGLMERTKTIE